MDKSIWDPIGLDRLARIDEANEDPLGRDRSTRIDKPIGILHGSIDRRIAVADSVDSVEQSGGEKRHAAGVTEVPVVTFEDQAPVCIQITCETTFARGCHVNHDECIGYDGGLLMTFGFVLQSHTQKGYNMQ